MMKIFSILFVFTAVFFLLPSCNKSDQPNNTGDIQQAQDNAKAEWIFEDAGDMAVSGIDGTLSLKSGENTYSNCATVTKDTVAVPHLITIDFGTTNCLCNDGSYRRGKVIVSFMGHYMDAGSFHTITFDGYYVNDNQVTGTRSVTNNGADSAGNTNWTVTIAGQIILANSAGTITWNANRLRTLIEGAATPARVDDVYSITGGGSGTRLNGNNWTAVIQTPLRLEVSCAYRHPVSGVVKISVTNKPDRFLNYGSGACDNVGTVTINGVSYNIVLH